MLCLACAATIAGPLVDPDRVLHHPRRSTGAILVDGWGRPFTLDPLTAIGRGLAAPGSLAIEHDSVAPDHATLALDSIGWVATARAPTWIDADEIGDDPHRLFDGSIVRVGEVAFYFVTAASTQRIAIGALRATASVDRASAELRRVPIALHRHAGGGIAKIDATAVTLSLTQFDLLATMVARMVAEADRPAAVRGFIPSSELLTRLAWDTDEPTENHLTQLVRRLRRTLEKSAVADLVESRHRFGYRLRVMPVIAAS